MAELPDRERDGGLSDTPKKIRDLQIALLKRATIADRIKRAFMLSEAAISLSRQGMKRRHPELSSDELDLLFIEHCYGSVLAQKLRILGKERNR